VLSNDFYVDDLLSGASTVEDAIKLKQELTSMLQTAGLTLRKWASNHSTFRGTIPKELQETQQTFSLENDDGVTTLGLLWNPQNDQLQVKSNLTQGQQTDSTASTKRKVLATTASIFDHLGLLSPAVIAYKIFLQKWWQDKLQWDDLLPAYLQQEWNQLHQTIPNLSQSRLTGRLYAPMLPTSKSMGSVIAVSEHTGLVSTYVPLTTRRRHLVNFCAPHQRLQPLKQITIPRLELCAATLLSKLYKKTTRALKIPVNESYLWTDSSIV